MSKTYVPVELRRQVANRANNSCEYCLVPLLFGFFTPYHIDHIISEKHGGDTTFENLAFACPACNNLKGSDIASYLSEEEKIIRLYHPRKDAWNEHFSLNLNGELSGRSEIALATIQLLHLNESSYSDLRRILIKGNIMLVPTSDI